MANIKGKEKTWRGRGMQAASAGQQSELTAKTEREVAAGIFHEQVQSELERITSDRASVTEEMQMEFLQKKVKVWEQTIPRGHGDKLKLESRAVMDLEKSR